MYLEIRRRLSGELCLQSIWEWTGWSMIMYIGGISQISEDVKEAARIDGANTWQEIIYIYIPALGSVHKSLLMLGIIGSLSDICSDWCHDRRWSKPCNRNARYLYFHERFYRKSDGICLCNICSSPDFCIGIDF